MALAGETIGAKEKPVDISTTRSGKESRDADTD